MQFALSPSTVFENTFLHVSYIIKRWLRSIVFHYAYCYAFMFVCACVFRSAALSCPADADEVRAHLGYSTRLARIHHIPHAERTRCHLRKVPPRIHANNV